MRFFKAASFWIVALSFLFWYLLTMPFMRLISLRMTQRYTAALARIVLGILFGKIEIRGQGPDSQDECVLYVVTHVSKLDPIVSVGFLPHVKRFILSYAIFKYNVFLGIAAWLVGNIFVGPKRSQAARKAVQKLENSHVVIYPEGDMMTKIGSFRRGYREISRRAGVRCVPVCITGMDRGISGNAGRHLVIGFGDAVDPGEPLQEVMIHMAMSQTGKARDEVAEEVPAELPSGAGRTRKKSM